MRICQVATGAEPIPSRGAGHLMVHAVRQLRFQRAASWALTVLLGRESYDVVHFHGQFAAAAGLR